MSHDITAAPEPGSAPRSYRVEFSGSGSEYFRIWIVNMLLLLVTLGIYAPWAKVRKLKYFHSNIRVDGHALDFHGEPRRMVRGYVLVAALFGVANAVGEFSPEAGTIASLALFGLWPALVMASLRFRLANTSWRGLRFRFAGTLGGAYKAFAVPLVFMALFLGAMTYVGLVSEEEKASSDKPPAAEQTDGDQAATPAPDPSEAGQAHAEADAEADHARADAGADPAASEPAMDEPAHAQATEPREDAEADAPAVAEEEAGKASDAGKSKPRRRVSSEAEGFIMLAATLGLLAIAPYFWFRLKSYQHNHYAYAQLQTELRSSAGDFYMLFLKAAGITVLLVGVSFGLAAVLVGSIFSVKSLFGAIFALIPLLFLAYIAVLIVPGSYFVSRLQNLLWSRTGNSRIRFKSELAFKPLALLMLKNWILTLLTLGFYWPFAAVALARLRLEAISLQTRIDLDSLANETRAAGNQDATGDAAGDLAGIDFGL